MTEIATNFSVWEADWLNFFEAPLKLGIGVDILILMDLLKVELMWLRAVTTGGTLMTHPPITFDHLPSPSITHHLPSPCIAYHRPPPPSPLQAR